ncbi:MAG: VOC family protein [Alphaproteobacteria bacterium]|nr:VOC family protein [Alphaproteobacteria bacterium]
MHIPPGFAAVTPYIFVDDAKRYLDFLQRAFGAEERGRSLRPDGKVANAQMAFGSATVMVSESQAEFPAGRSAFYLYVADADASMARAIAAGAKNIMDVADMPYGDRQGGVRDSAGNIWWISQRLSAGPYFNP